jgi:hypothetical protein
MRVMNQMNQRKQQTPAEPAPDRVRPPYQFKPGQSGNLLGRRAVRIRLEDKMAELAGQYGGLDVLSPLERTLVEQAAALLTRKGPVSAEDHVRISNAVVRLLSRLEKSRRKVAPKPPTLAAWAASGAPADSGVPTTQRHRGKSSVRAPNEAGEASGESWEQMWARPYEAPGEGG